MQPPAEAPPAQQSVEPLEDPKKPPWPSTPMGVCQQMVAKSLKRNMVVKFMMDELAEVCARQGQCYISVARIRSRRLKGCLLYTCVYGKFVKICTVQNP